jgi:hypothetical protein
MCEEAEIDIDNNNNNKSTKFYYQPLKIGVHFLDIPYVTYIFMYVWMLQIYFVHGAKCNLVRHLNG